VTSIWDRPLKARTISGLDRRRRSADFVATALVTLSMVIALLPLVWVLCSVVAQGFKAITSSVWWTHSQSGTTEFATGGGAYHAIAGTALQGLVCTTLSVPIGVMVAIYLVEYGGGTPLGRLATFMVDILSGVPSIVAALFIYALLVATMGLPRSEFALGIPKWKTIARIVIPTGMAGIITGIMLAVARVLGETAPLLILVGYSQAINFNIFSGFMGSLPGMMYYQISAGAGSNPVPTDRLWGAALTLILMIAVINIGARAMARIFAPRKS
jgi:phosphate transport system permease protein